MLGLIRCLMVPIDTYELVFATGDVGDIHVVGGRAEIFVLLLGEDVEGDKVDLGVTVLASLGGGHIDDLAGTALDDNVTVLAQSRALHGVGGRSASIGGFEGLLVLYAKQLVLLLVISLILSHIKYSNMSPDNEAWRFRSDASHGMKWGRGWFLYPGTSSPVTAAER